MTDPKPAGLEPLTLRSDYPRPQLQRRVWQTLNGRWQFAFGTGAAETPAQVAWTHDILVPFPPESAASGLHDEAFHPRVWYRRSFTVPSAWQGQRVRLHFGAVDYRAQVWVNAQHVATHEGGHTPFWADITDALVEGGGEGAQEVVVCATDDPLALDQPRGKQDWLREPHGIWYPRTTGIWQTVWLEPVSALHLETLRLTPDAAQFKLELEAELAGVRDDARLEVTLRRGERTLVQDTVGITGARVARTLHLPDPGIDDARAEFLWSPETPNLLELSLKLYDGDTLSDEVASYTALRQFEVRGDAFFLNSRPYFLRLALDQGYWDESLLAAPNEDALRADVELAKQLGFNGVRKHQKLEDPRYLYWADHLGLLVWTELPSAYAFTPNTAPRLTREWLEALERDYSHPCVAVWVAFNESWGVPELPVSAQQRHLVAALYHLAKTLGGGRPVVGNDGWEHVVSDLLTVHDYHNDPDVLRERYETAAACAATAAEVRPAGRDIVLPDAQLIAAPVVLSEFGGVRYARSGSGWGYDQVETSDALVEKYRALIEAASSPGLAGFCYTQFADTFQEQNGLLFSDRTPKAPLGALHDATAQRRR